MGAEMIDRLRAMLADLRILAEPATNQPYDCNNESFSLDAAALEAAIAALSATTQAEASARGYVDDDRKRIVSSLQEMRDRLGGFLVGAYGDRFDGDIDTMLDAINLLKAIKIGPATPQAATGYIVDAVAWESFVADYSRYVDGKRDTPFVSIREGLAAVIDSARPTTPQAAQVPAGYALVPVEPTLEMRIAGMRWADFPTKTWAVMLAAAQPQGVG